MKVTKVDERDAQLEMEADGFRVLIVHPGRRITAYNIDGVSAQEAFKWAAEKAPAKGSFSLAARTDHPSRGGVSLMYLTPLPETVMDLLDGKPSWNLSD